VKVVHTLQDFPHIELYRGGSGDEGDEDEQIVDKEINSSA